MIISEFDVTSLEYKYKDQFKAPFVKGAPIQIALKYQEEYFIHANSTILMIGMISGLYIDQKLLHDDGFVNLSDGRIAAINGPDGYAIPSLKQRFGYQRPKPT